MRTRLAGTHPRHAVTQAQSVLKQACGAAAPAAALVCSLMMVGMIFMSGDDHGILKGTAAVIVLGRPDTAAASR